MKSLLNGPLATFSRYQKEETWLKLVTTEVLLFLHHVKDYKQDAIKSHPTDFRSSTKTKSELI